MRIFDAPNLSNDWKCPICKTNEEKPVVLVPVAGTMNHDVCEAFQVHVHCLDLWWYKDFGIMMKF